jgi:hypothetical protein
LRFVSVQGQIVHLYSGVGAIGLSKAREGSYGPIAPRRLQRMNGILSTRLTVDEFLRWSKRPGEGPLRATGRAGDHAAGAKRSPSRDRGPPLSGPVRRDRAGGRALLCAPPTVPQCGSTRIRAVNRMRSSRRSQSRRRPHSRFRTRWCSWRSLSPSGKLRDLREKVTNYGRVPTIAHNRGRRHPASHQGDDGGRSGAATRDRAHPPPQPAGARGRSGGGVWGLRYRVRSKC